MADPGTVQVVLPSDLADVLKALAARRKTDPGEVLGEALVLFDQVTKASDEGGQVVIPPSGVIGPSFRQTIRLTPPGTVPPSE